MLAARPVLELCLVAETAPIPFSQASHRLAVAAQVREMLQAPNTSVILVAQAAVAQLPGALTVLAE